MKLYCPLPTKKKDIFNFMPLRSGSGGMDLGWEGGSSLIQCRVKARYIKSSFLPQKKRERKKEKEISFL